LTFYLDTTLHDEFPTPDPQVPDIANEVEIETGSDQHLDSAQTSEFFRDYAAKATLRYDSIRPGHKTGDSMVTDIRGLKYDPNGFIYYKLDLDLEWQELPRRPKPVNPKMFPALYSDKLKITEKKWKDLQSLKSVLPADCHSFYDALPH